MGFSLKCVYIIGQYCVTLIFSYHYNTSIIQTTIGIHFKDVICFRTCLLRDGVFPLEISSRAHMFACKQTTPHTLIMTLYQV